MFAGPPVPRDDAGAPRPGITIGSVCTVRIVEGRRSGAGHIAVWTFGDTSELLVNGVGRSSGTQPVPAGNRLIAVNAETADGAWTITRG